MTRPLPTPRILAFAGSTRRRSWNKQLVAIAAEGARQAGAEVTLIDLKDYPLPLFDEDLEAESGLPASAVALQELFLAHQGLLIASPEYNSSVTAVLKNTIDWVSRGSGERAPLAAFQGKAAALISASPGGLGGMRGLVHLRAILGNINVLVLPQQYSVSQAFAAFDEQGRLTDSHQDGTVRQIGAALAHIVAKLSG